MKTEMKPEEKFWNRVTFGIHQAMSNQAPFGAKNDFGLMKWKDIQVIIKRFSRSKVGREMARQIAESLIRGV